MAQSSSAERHAETESNVDARPLGVGSGDCDAADSSEATGGAESLPPRRVDPSRAFVADHVDFVWRLLRRLGVPASDVDDATQQVLIIAVKRIADITEGSERSFLYGTAVRVAASFRRSAFRHKRKLGDWRWGTQSSTAQTVDEIERREAVALLDEALSGLSDDLRRVFVLCEIEEIPAREVAVLENIPPGTVASRLRRAREMFATRLRELCGTEPRTP